MRGGGRPRPEGTWDTSDVGRVEEVLRNCLALCRQAGAGAKLGTAERERADVIAGVPVAAAGALESMQVRPSGDPRGFPYEHGKAWDLTRGASPFILTGF